jgi:hypothetical protein
MELRGLFVCVLCQGSDGIRVSLFVDEDAIQNQGRYSTFLIYLLDGVKLYTNMLLRNQMLYSDDIGVKKK